MIRDIFFNLFIMPLELIFEIIFCLTYRLFSNPGLSILTLSLAMNFLVLPLYKRADAIREKEKDKINAMAPWVNHIKKTFKGDERYMILNEYYRQKHYRPIESLRGSLSLILQIPFFIAAYHYLSNLTLLNNMKFLIFKDLGAPDGLINFGGISINLMPIIMTVINVASAYIYLRGFPVRDKIQTYGIAAIFLVLLYNSPSGLVFYWTLNQVFSLCKNLIMKGLAAKRRAQTMPGAKVRRTTVPKSEMQMRRTAHVKRRRDNLKPRAVYFILPAIILTVTIGVLIPQSVIVSSPVEFDTAVNTPLNIIIRNFCIAAGFFLVWSGIFYILARSRGRRAMSSIFFMMSVGALINFMFFGRNMGTISAYLVFDENVAHLPEKAVFNVILMVIVAVAAVLLMKLLPKAAGLTQIILLVAVVAIGGYNTYEISRELKLARSSGGGETEAEKEPPKEKIIPLSRNGQNVIVFMLDRAMSGYIPYMFEEKPELAKEFDGFTYYPNTLAYGGHTNFAAPPIFGGYEYTPTAMNSRGEESLKDKHNEALKVLPTLFAGEDFRVTVCDVPYGNYKWISDLSIYDDSENTKAYSLIGRFSDEYNKKYGGKSVKVQTRNFFMYSLMKSAPLFAQETVYDKGSYFSTGERVSVEEAFLDNYAVLCALPGITDVTDSGEDTFLMMNNEAPHEITLLSLPDYVPGTTENILNYAQDAYVHEGVVMHMETERQISHYHVNMATFLKIGDWLEHLKAEGVYDNTKIIIVSDHGYSERQFDYMIMEGMLDVQWYSSLLLVKDFGSRGELITDNSFMTAADVPALATDGVIDNPENPFTGKPINSDAKAHDQIITTSHNYGIYTNNGNVFDTSDGEWFSVHDNIFDKNNWTRLGERDD
ncbi:MAG: YidC/Oxa1 family membrane protein insertase [Lachnospiraceae bacterium]|jgi:YidC/Oxa1 family membrane protein insertase